MAVLVLYNRDLKRATPWSVLSDWLADDRIPQFRHCLIYDNSPEAMVDPNDLPCGAHTVWDPANHGTAGAYIAAAALALKYKCDWLLLLDQDTVLPSNYLDQVEQAIIAGPSSVVLLPRIRQGTDLLSPAKITPAGSVRPCADPAHTKGMTTAISSGAVVKADIITRVVFPPTIWLDYVDHWMFLEVARQKSPIGIIDTDLSHDLSVRTLTTLSASRLRSILAAESTFYGRLGMWARALLPVRRILRAFRYIAAGRPSLAGVVVGTLTHTKRRP